MLQGEEGPRHVRSNRLFSLLRPATLAASEGLAGRSMGLLLRLLASGMASVGSRAAIALGAVEPVVGPIDPDAIIAALGAYGLLLVLGLDADRSGNTITVISEGVSHPLNVAEACSGMRMVVAFTALGTFLAYTQMHGLVQRTLMVLSAIPVAVAVNILRIVTLGVLSLADSNFATGEFHHFVGLVWMLPGLLLFLGVQWVINNVMVDDRGALRAV